MWLGAIAILVLGIGCARADDCQQAARKLRFLVEERARQVGELAPDHQMSEAAKDREVDELAAQCRARRKQHPEDPMVTTKCVLAASTDDAVRACVAAAND